MHDQSGLFRCFILEEVYLNIFEDTTDPLERRMLAQRIVDVIALRPRLDLQDSHQDCSLHLHMDTLFTADSDQVDIRTDKWCN